MELPSPRKDKYNKKINKYHVETDEQDESMDEDLERVVHESTKAGVSFFTVVKRYNIACVHVG